MTKKFRFIEKSTENVIDIEKADQYITASAGASIFYDFNPDNDGLTSIGIGDAKQWFHPSDLREFADLLNFLADEGDKVQ